MKSSAPRMMACRAADFLLALERDRSIAGDGLPAATVLEGADSLVFERDPVNRERHRAGREAGPAPSARSAGRAPTRDMLERARTAGLGR
jgi:hypothetical protein